MGHHTVLWAAGALRAMQAAGAMCMKLEVRTIKVLREADEIRLVEEAGTTSEAVIYIYIPQTIF